MRPGSPHDRVCRTHGWRVHKVHKVYEVCNVNKVSNSKYPACTLGSIEHYTLDSNPHCVSAVTRGEVGHALRVSQRFVCNTDKVRACANVIDEIGTVEISKRDACHSLFAVVVWSHLRRGATCWQGVLMTGSAALAGAGR